MTLTGEPIELLLHAFGRNEVRLERDGAAPDVAAVAPTTTASGTLTAGILVAIRALLGVRSSLAEEVTGMDSSEHGEEAYHAGDLGEMGGSAGALGHGVVLIRPAGPQKTRDVA